MAIFTITNGESTELAVVKVTPVVEDCFTLYEYIVTTNNGDNITIELSGNHYEAKYFDNAGNEISFSDTTTLVYNTYLKVRFLLLNSGVTGVYPNATINIKNTTLDKYYENYVERDNDNPNCYDNIQYVQSVNGNNVDNTDPLNPIINIPDLSGYLPLNGSEEMTGDLDMGSNDINDVITIVLETLVAQSDVITPNLTSNAINSSSLSGTGDRMVIADSSGTLSTQAIPSGAGTIDTTITNGSTNPVENNAIYDALQTKAGLSEINTFTEINNTFDEAVNFDKGIFISTGGGSTKANYWSIFSSSDNSISLLNGNNSNGLEFVTSALSTNRTYAFPNKNGTIALLDDIGTPNATHTGEVTGSTVLTITNNAVTNNKLADNSVSTTKILSGNVTSTKLADTSVTAGSYTNANITVNSKGQITAASNGSGGSTPYLIYVARITQDGTSAPVVNVLQDTTSGITWTRDSTGVYRGAPTNLSEYVRTDTVGFAHTQNGLGPQYSIGLSFETAAFIQLISMTDGVATDSSLNGMIEIRFY